MRHPIANSSGMHMHRRICIDVDFVCSMHDYFGDMFNLWTRKLVWRWICDGNHLYVLHWACINGDDIECLRWDFRNVLNDQRRLRVHFDNVHRVCDYYCLLLDDRLRRGQRVRGRGSAARRVQLQCGLLIFIDHDNRVCGYHGHLPRVRCLPQLHG